MNEKITLKNKASVVITPGLQSQITVLHNQCPQDKEWSGLLVYKVTKGDINKLVNDLEDNEVEISAEHVFPMDFGDAAYTEFAGSEDWIKYFELYPQVDPLRDDKNNGYYTGKLHSHHNMKAFHSGTDTQDIVENAPKLPMFLSLVCNYSCNPFAEIGIAYQIETETKIKEKKSMKLWKWFGADQDEVTEKEEKVIRNGTIIIPCDVFYETDQSLLDQIKAIKNKVAESTIPFKPSNVGFQYQKESTNYYKDWKSVKVSYTDIFKDLPDLILLGNSTDKMFALEALNLATKNVTHTNMSDYTKAFKEYFTNYWFPIVFRGTNTKEEDVLDTIIQWSMQHSKIWVARQIKASCDELKKESSVLWTV